MLASLTTSGVKILAQRSAEKREGTATQTSAVKLEKQTYNIKHKVLDSIQDGDQGNGMEREGQSLSSTYPEEIQSETVVASMMPQQSSTFSAARGQGNSSLKISRIRVLGLVQVVLGTSWAGLRPNRLGQSLSYEDRKINGLYKQQNK